MFPYRTFANTEPRQIKIYMHKISGKPVSKQINTTQVRTVGMTDYDAYEILTSEASDWYLT